MREGKGLKELLEMWDLLGTKEDKALREVKVLRVLREVKVLKET